MEINVKRKEIPMLARLVRFGSKILNWLKRQLGIATKPYPTMSYEHWKVGRTDYYRMLDIERPTTDIEFDCAELHLKEVELLGIFNSQTGGPVETKDADLILAKVREAFEVLGTAEQRVLYNLRLDHKKPNSNFKIASIMLQVVSISLLFFSCTGIAVVDQFLRRFLKTPNL